MCLTEQFLYQIYFEKAKIVKLCQSHHSECETISLEYLSFLMLFYLYTIKVILCGSTFT